jgi:hypothetical protein
MSVKNKQHRHSSKSRPFYAFLSAAIFLIILSAGCDNFQADSAALHIIIEVDGQDIPFQVNSGTSVDTVLQLANVETGTLDQITPSRSSILVADTKIVIARITETYETEETLIPYDTQTIKNETLPEGQTLLVQAGINGKMQTTYRIINEDNVEKSRTVFKQEITVEPRPEIVMVGVQTPFMEITLSGRLVYLTSGNAWLMDETTGNRRPIITTGDLDGRALKLSRDRSWLLYSRSVDEQEADQINHLWMVNLDQEDAKPIDLRVSNVVHFADWVPGEALTVAYSTVETRASAPGWQANNDLFVVSYTSSGIIVKKDEILSTNSGGIYGWWGTEMYWSQDGTKLAYARPDMLGTIDLDEQEYDPIIGILPFQTRGSWAWVPGITWSPDGDLIYTVIHRPQSDLENKEASPYFDLNAIGITTSILNIPLVSSTGMFAYPVASPFLEGDHYEVAFLQAAFPEQSDTSPYKLVIMDQDGSNRKVIFPPEGTTGIDPQQVLWGSADNSDRDDWIALTYQGNLWLINTQDSKAYQITGDNSISKIDWK